MLLLYKELEFDRIEVVVFEFAVVIVNNKMKERRWSCRMQQNILLPGCGFSRYE